MAFSEELKQGHTGAMLVNLEGRNYYLIYEKVNIQDWELLGIVPADIVNASMNELQFSCLLYTSPSPRDHKTSRITTSA